MSRWLPNPEWCPAWSEDWRRRPWAPGSSYRAVHVGPGHPKVRPGWHVSPEETLSGFVVTLGQPVARTVPRGLDSFSPERLLAWFAKVTGDAPGYAQFWKDEAQRILDGRPRDGVTLGMAMPGADVLLSRWRILAYKYRTPGWAQRWEFTAGDVQPGGYATRLIGWEWTLGRVFATLDEARARAAPGEAFAWDAEMGLHVALEPGAVMAC